MPLVSVILPTYNRKSFLKAAVESVLQQTYDEFELIVVDGGSDDGSVEFLESIPDDRLELVAHEHPHGLSAARNAGLEIASGEHIVFLDDDDRLYSDAIATLVETIRGQPRSCGGVYTAHKLTYESGKQGVFHTPEGKIEQYEVSSIDGPSCTLVRRAVVDEIGMFDESLPAFEDVDFWIWLFEAFDMIALDRVLYERRFHDDQMIKDPALMLRGQTRVVEKHREILSDNSLTRIYGYIGRSQAKLGRMAQARENLRRAIGHGARQKGLLYYCFWLHFGSPGYAIGRWLHCHVYRRACERLGVY
jgi:glycosyltransferase involved in cell wall biosynthesis